MTRGPTAVAWLVALTICVAPAVAQELKLAPADIAAAAKSGGGAGTSGMTDIQTTVLYGNPTKAALYVIEIRVPRNTRTAAHRHRDDRTAVVLSEPGGLAMARLRTTPA